MTNSITVTDIIIAIGVFGGPLSTLLLKIWWEKRVHVKREIDSILTWADTYNISPKALSEKLIFYGKPAIGRLEEWSKSLDANRVQKEAIKIALKKLRGNAEPKKFRKK